MVQRSYETILVLYDSRENKNSLRENNILILSQGGSRGLVLSVSLNKTLVKSFYL